MTINAETRARARGLLPAAAGGLRGPGRVDGGRRRRGLQGVPRRPVRLLGVGSRPLPLADALDRSNVYSANFKRSAGPIAARWFEDGATNIAYNCLDRQVEAGLGDKLCFIAERNDEGETSPLQPETYTYAEALEETKKLAAALRAKGVKKGDRVALFMPMVPELAIAMLACARIGAVHTVVFGGFSRDCSRRIARVAASFFYFTPGATTRTSSSRRASSPPTACAAAARSSTCGASPRTRSLLCFCGVLRFLSFCSLPVLARRARRALGLAPPWGAPRRVTARRGLRGTRSRDSWFRDPHAIDAQPRRRRGTRARRSRAAR